MANPLLWYHRLCPSPSPAPMLGAAPLSGDFIYNGPALLFPEFTLENIRHLASQFCLIHANTKAMRTMPTDWHRFGFCLFQNFVYLFVFGCAGSSLLLRLFSPCGEQGPPPSCHAWASHCGGLSLQHGLWGRGLQ